MLQPTTVMSSLRTNILLLLFHVLPCPSYKNLIALEVRQEDQFRTSLYLSARYKGRGSEGERRERKLIRSSQKSTELSCCREAPAGEQKAESPDRKETEQRKA